MQKDEIIEALKKPMTIIELCAALPHIRPDNIAPIVCKLRKDGKICAVGSKLEKWRMTEKQHFIYSSRDEDLYKAANFVKVMNGTWTNFLGIKPPPKEMCKGVTRHVCHDDEE